MYKVTNIQFSINKLDKTTYE